ncbi:MAG: hypothetical protein ACRDSR_03525 [Pseudonocardiaceae bacterium]
MATLEAAQAGLPKLSAAMRVFRRWAQRRGLVPSETGHVARTRDRRPLRFSVSGTTEPVRLPEPVHRRVVPRPP